MIKYFLFFIACAISARATPNKIVKQVQQGNSIIVNYADGTVTTNALVLRMSKAVVKARAKAKSEQEALSALAYLIADTRSNIPQVSNLTDNQVALLYLAQMRKDATELAKTSPSNSLEYVIGAGIRQDLNQQPKDNNHD